MAQEFGEVTCLSIRFIRVVLCAAFSLSLGMGAPSTSAASFNCSKARPGVEQAICLDPGLSRLDEQMASAYWAVLANTADSTFTRKTQRDWLRFSRNVCTSLECLREVYQQRIDALVRGRPGDLSFVGAMGAVYSSLDALPYGLSYGPVKSESKSIADWLLASKLLEGVYASASKFTSLPSDLRITTRQCGQVNAVYFSSKNSIVLCYELVEALTKAHRQRMAVDTESHGGTVEARRLLNGLRFTVLHEFGHAMFKWHEKDGLLGREESAADSFASVVLLDEKVKDEDVNDALWGVWTLFQTLKNVSMDHPSDEHEYNDQRLYNFNCLLGGRAPSFLPALVNANLLTPARSQRCSKEWRAAFLGVQSISRRAVAVQ